MAANDIQQGGTHYKDKGLQPWDVIIAWDMGFLDGNALKYLARYKQKNGKQDLEKAIHYIQKIIETEYPTIEITNAGITADKIKGLNGLGGVNIRGQWPNNYAAETEELRG